MIKTTNSTQERTERYDRYPGPRSFVDNDIDRDLFFGREHEIEHLLHRVRAVQFLVLFAKSGLGKTSLLQAGLYSRLREHGLLPIPVRLNQPEAEPVRTVLDALRAECQARRVQCASQDTEGLWEFFKATDLWQGEVLLTPVLVFDQFEEIFTLQSEKARASFGTQLGELAGRGLPSSVRKRLQTGEKMRSTDTPPNVKVILSLREEYVGALEDLAPHVPAVFEQRFRLAPLSKEVARRAVVEPAALERPDLFETRPFRYEERTLDDMLAFLADRQGEVEPFQLQVVCRHAEQQVSKRQREQNGAVEVDEVLLGGRKAMENLMNGFYLQAIRQLPRWGQRSRAREFCELGLISPNGHRVSIEHGQIRQQYKVNDASLDKLAQTRLIRKESRPRLEGFYYELSHDSVARAVSRSRRFRVPTRVKLVGLAAFVLLTGIGGWLAQQTYKADRQAVEARQRAEVTASVSQGNLKELIKRGGLLEPEMIIIHSGKFRMGDIQGDENEKPVRQVTIKPFAIGQYEITFEQYDQFALATDRELPSDEAWGRGRRPVINVSWRDAVDYATWLSQQTGKRYRLPTESEWEYAARSGKSDTWAGTSDESQLRDYAVFSTKSTAAVGGTQPVGGKKPNGLGLYDMSGNVWEWVEDCWHANYTEAPADGSPWLEASNGHCSLHVIRGGSWNYPPWTLRASFRGRNYTNTPYRFIGFRLVQDID